MTAATVGIGLYLGLVGTDVNSGVARFSFDIPELTDGIGFIVISMGVFGYGEIKPMGARAYESSMLNVFRRLDAENFQTVLIERKEDIWPSFKAFLAKDKQQD